MTRPLSLSNRLVPGQRIGSFVLLAPLGSGGSGRIWAAARLGQLGFNKRMVLKVMREDRLSSASALRRFDREACLGGRLRHPNLRAVHDLGSHEGRPYMALSWVDTSLSELLQLAPHERLAPDVACWIGMQCCSALSAAHGWIEDGRARPIVHRDVSPGNILLSVDGHALLADLAAPEDEGSGTGSTPPRFFGNLAYAAPEALRQEVLDGRADLYSLGCVLFEALAGSPAFEGDDERAVMFQILERGAPELRRRAPALPAPLAQVVQRCLARRREERFESAAELRAALSACCQQRAAFSLEQQTAAFIREVLGARIREREEMMHGAFERFAPSALGRTDTLPIAPAIARATASLSLSGPASNPDPSVPGAAVSQRRPARRRWQALTLLFALLVLIGVFASTRRRIETISTRADRDTRDVAAASPAASGSDTLVPSPEAPRAARDSVGARDEPANDAGSRGVVTSARGAEPSVATELATPAPPSTSAQGPRPRGIPSPTPRADRARTPEPGRADGDPFAGMQSEGNPYEKLKRERDAVRAAGSGAQKSPAPAAQPRAAPSTAESAPSSDAQRVAPEPSPHAKESAPPPRPASEPPRK